MYDSCYDKLPCQSYLISAARIDIRSVSFDAVIILACHFLISNNRNDF